MPGAHNKYNINYSSTSEVDTKDIGMAIEEMVTVAKNRRKIFERRWYDNNFFDDGFHFRYLSRSSNRIVDLSERSTVYTPQRSIPKASKQIRGLTNLLVSSDPTPTIYPSTIDKEDYPDIQPTQQQIQQAVQQGQQPPQPQVNLEYTQALKEAKDIALKKGLWLKDEWARDDGTGESILDKLTFMVLLTMKHSVSYLKIWPDPYDEKIRTSVRDAFDLWLIGNITSIYDSPFIVDAHPMLIAQIKANPLFDKNQLEKITPDNRKASSEIKEAYLLGRFGRDSTSDQVATLILNEAFIKEYVNEENTERIMRQDDGGEILKRHKMGEPIIRHAYTAGGVWLYDQYTNLSEYPYVDFRLEPGPIYQVPMIERFIPTNKSLDSVVSRVERYTHTMVTGSWLKRRGEQFTINNIAGGQVIEYETTPPTQSQIAPLPAFVYQFIDLLTGFIEEQGVSTATIGKVPNGIQANAAIESLKESEYANLVMATRRLKASAKKIAQKCLEIADESYITPQAVTYKNKGQAVTFKVIGKNAYDQRKKLKIENPGLIPLSKDEKLDIEIEQGMAFTKEGQKASIQLVLNTMIQLLQVGAIPVTALQGVAAKYLESYQYGGTEEFMDSIQEAMEGGMTNITQQQMKLIQTSVLQALQDVGEVGKPASDRRIQENELGTINAMKRMKIVPNANGGATIQKPLSETLGIQFKDLPEDAKKQVLAQIGIQTNMVSPTGTDQMQKHAQILKEAISPIKNPNQPQNVGGKSGLQ